MKNPPNHWSPLMIRVLMHYHYSPLPWGAENLVEASQVHADWVALGCLERALQLESGYRLTDRGNALLGLWMTTPLPTAAWVDSNGDVCPDPLAVIASEIGPPLGLDNQRD